MNARIQLSLYVPRTTGTMLESVRNLLDPIQARLIPAHVTLCREDEIADIAPSLLRTRLAALNAKPISLGFGRPEMFYEHGVLLPCVAGEPAFRELRHHLLASETVRAHEPHITLAHPRNPKSAGNTTANISLVAENITITFATVRLIQQTGSAPWQVLEQYEMTGR